jgi:cytochrome aa3-600 menaquinol oxidase subunit III
VSTVHEAIVGRHPHGEHADHAHDDSEIKIFGFWIFLASDLILFSCLFATYTILQTHTGVGPRPQDLYDVNIFTAETLILLVSSFTSGLATYQMQRRNRTAMVWWIVVTLLLGISFIWLEVSEFIKYATHGAPISKSAFLSAFFILVGTHGCHVSLGIVWMTCILIQLLQRGINAITSRKFFIVSLYWHFLDVVWVFIFTVVYLPGVMD